MPQAGFNPRGEKWQLCLNIVVALPPKPPRLFYAVKIFRLELCFSLLTKTELDVVLNFVVEETKAMSLHFKNALAWSKFGYFIKQHHKAYLRQAKY